MAQDVAAYRLRVLKSLFDDDSAPQFKVAWVDDTRVALKETQGDDPQQVVVNLHKTHANNLRGNVDLPSVDQQLNKLVKKLVLKEAGKEGKGKQAIVSLVSAEAQSDYEASISHGRVEGVVLDLIMEGRLVPQDGLLKKAPNTEKGE